MRADGALSAEPPPSGVQSFIFGIEFIARPYPPFISRYTEKKWRRRLYALAGAYELSRFRRPRLPWSPSRETAIAIHKIPEMSLPATGARLTIEEVFAAQRKTAIALRTSTAQMRREKLRRLEDAVFAHRAAI
jgi:hypothetical protein